jgi:uncharacterized protein YbjT (DUF2867 family)
MTSILVLGGTGLLGRPVVQQLVDEGAAVRVLTRRATEAVGMLNSSVDIQQGDATDAAALDRAIEGCDGVHISISGSDEPGVVEAVVAAAPAHGVQRITYLSGATVHPDNGWFPMVAQKLRAEKALEASQVAATTLCPTWPMEQLPRFVRNGQATIFGEQPTPLHWVAVADLARMVSAALRSIAAVGRRLYIHGPEAYTMHDALARYCRAEHPGIEPTIVPIDIARRLAETGGDPALGFMVEMMAYFDRAGEGGESSEANRILGAPEITLDAWLRDRARRQPGPDDV